MSHRAPAAPGYVATIPGVQEVMLVGHADPDPWAERLRPLGLRPRAEDGRAVVTVGATSLRWMGVRFRELTLAVAVSPDGGGQGDHSYLAAAFSSSLAFAWMERTFFRTPYQPATIQLQPRAPASVALAVREAPVLRAAMAGERPPARREEQWWEGSVFLPRDRAGRGGMRAAFAARLGGLTDIYPFLPDIDTLDVAPSSGLAALQWLRDSHFVPHEWRLRTDAVHARSRTAIVPLT